MAIRRPKHSVSAEPEAPREALTAATAIVDLSMESSWKTFTFGNRDWQTEAWRLYDIIPEFHFLAGRIGDSVSQARLFVTEVDENGEEAGETQNEQIARLAAVPLGKGAQRDDNLRLAGIDLAAPGECYFVGEGAAQRPHEASGSWFVVTGAGIKNEAGRIKVRRPLARDGGWITLQSERDFLIRCWRPHPNDIDQADSFARPAIPVLREIELLGKREFAELDSRLTGAGILPIPESVDLPRDPNSPEDQPQLQSFAALMQRTMATSMRDQSTAAATVPIMFTVADEMYEKVRDMKPITFWSELSAEIGPMKERALSRLATSAELPKEVLTGLGDGNHWSAWLITEEGIRWIRGYLSIIADALTRGFLHKALEAMGVPDPERYAFSFDTSPLAARPNRLEEALQLHERMLLKDEEVVKAGAFDPEQMPTVQERAVQILLKQVQLDPSLILRPEIQRLLGLPTIEAPAEPQQPVRVVSELGQEDDEPETDGPPNNGNAEAPALTASLNRRILELQSAPPSAERVFNAACRLHVLRALELAGGRLTTPAERRQRWAEIPRHELHAQIGPITPDKAQRVTAGSWSHIGTTAADFAIDPAYLETMLSGYVNELLTRGMRHHDDLLFAALSIANRGKGMIKAEVAA